MTARMPRARTREIVVQELENECLVYDLKTNVAVSLNSVSTEIWKRCDGTTNVQEVADILGKQMNLKLDEDFIWFAIDDFEKNNLLAEKAIRPNSFKQPSRRKILLKYGLPVLLLPIAASIVSPLAAQTASCKANGTVLISNSGCDALNAPPTQNESCCSGLDQGFAPKVRKFKCRSPHGVRAEKHTYFVRVSALFQVFWCKCQNLSSFSAKLLIKKFL